MMATAQPRPFTSHDKQACLALFDANVPRYFDAAEREEFDAFLTSKPHDYLVLENGGRIIACGGVTWHQNDTVAGLAWGMVAPEHQDTGFGRYLLEARLELIRARGAASQVVLSTSQHTAGFYKRFGFQVTSTTPDGFGPGLDEVEMKRPL